MCAWVVVVVSAGVCGGGVWVLSGDYLYEVVYWLRDEC